MEYINYWEHDSVPSWRKFPMDDVEGMRKIENQHQNPTVITEEGKIHNNY